MKTRSNRNGSRFRVTFWGVRGSYPVSSADKLRFGGHTSCVEIEAGGRYLIFDAGTGIIPLGKRLLQRHKSGLHLCVFLSHTHHDHLIGLYFFEPLLKETTTLAILGPQSASIPLKSILETAMDSRFFPIGLEDFKAETAIHSLDGDERIWLDGARASPVVERGRSWRTPPDDTVIIDTHKSDAHPRSGVLLYRVTYRNAAVVYATDIEQQEGGYPDVIEFARGADLLIHDAQYVQSEYISRSKPRRGWGHSTVDNAIAVAKAAAVKRLILFHHEPTRDDRALRAIEQRARKQFNAAAAYEGMTIDLP
ncbi:MAG TPA: MBL fold metallo-hydrolase [Candidatus Eisenbacteria bacterium]|nr:MBL fold metallo-hydrolase [Candidatus Eisenbacteria bacterium]